MTNILDVAGEHVAMYDAAFSVGCAAAASAWQVRFDSLNRDDFTLEEAARESNRVADLVMSAVKAAYIKAVNR